VVSNAAASTLANMMLCACQEQRAPQTHFELDDVGMQRAEAVVQQLPRHDALHVGAPLNEVDRHLVTCLQVEGQLHKARRPAARNTTQMPSDLTR